MDEDDGRWTMDEDEDDGRPGMTYCQTASKANAFLFTESSYPKGMPSFDIVSEVNSMEIENAVNQARKELASRFDFKGSKAEIVLEKNEITLSAEDQFKIKA